VKGKLLNDVGGDLTSGGSVESLGNEPLIIEAAVGVSAGSRGPGVLLMELRNPEDPEGSTVGSRSHFSARIIDSPGLGTR
jgi:hypothetical protein